MSVSLYYSAHRAAPLTEAESSAIECVVAAHTTSFPYDDEESLYLYELSDDGPEERVAGATKMPSDFDRLMPVLTHLLHSVTELRRVLSDAEWAVHMDDIDIPWDEAEGYSLSGMSERRK
ncbi:hypothetical protein EDD95_4671 [Streptomyces sp. CEV 2-1]|uniref:hypothetical protein n=1 Tax=unclassified Streptomyces TaxID=2593676 RepID=UPI000F470D0D|nr:hypothetical protein [Streptomyces sp. CEV 2-1]ROQ78093.1 hypothetical protein EDD95_4671 [Streptomyces sp. CEV 2-1]